MRCLRRARNDPYHTNEQHRPNGLARRQDLEGWERREPAELSMHSRRQERAAASYTREDLSPKETNGGVSPQGSKVCVWRSSMVLVYMEA